MAWTHPAKPETAAKLNVAQDRFKRAAKEFARFTEDNEHYKFGLLAEAAVDLGRIMERYNEERNGCA